MLHWTSHSTPTDMPINLVYIGFSIAQCYGMCIVRWWFAWDVITISIQIDSTTFINNNHKYIWFSGFAAHCLCKRSNVETLNTLFKLHESVIFVDVTFLWNPFRRNWIIILKFVYECMYVYVWFGFFVSCLPVVHLYLYTQHILFHFCWIC